MAILTEKDRDYIEGWAYSTYPQNSLWTWIKALLSDLREAEEQRDFWKKQFKILEERGSKKAD